MPLTFSQHIEAPIERVFELLDDDEQLKLWMDGVEETTYPDGRNVTDPVGTRFRMKIREGGRVQEYDGEVVAYAPPRHLAITIGNAMFRMRVDYRLSAENGGTRLDYTCEPEYTNWLIRLIGLCFGWLTRRILRRQMLKLKSVAERLPPEASERPDKLQKSDGI